MDGPGLDDSRNRDRPPVEAGRDAPEWVTEPLIALTLKVWQPYYSTPLSRDEAIAMIINVGRLYHVIAREQKS